MKYIEIKKILFTGKQNISWCDVEKYLRKYDGMEIRNNEYGDIIKINAIFSDEYVHSQYTRRLRGGLAKAKANLVQIIPEIIAEATNRRWVENKDKKHSEDAIRGWYRYDIRFSMNVCNSQNGEYSTNYYNATAVARINDIGVFLYDIVNIKKEASKPTDC
ncbi:MAG: hypothetical protein IJ141_09160 [Lachnospiraceae bacterium]|nr:hypothetical protein [Lachnospiraceae bacterium]